MNTVFSREVFVLEIKRWECRNVISPLRSCAYFGWNPLHKGTQINFQECGGIFIGDWSWTQRGWNTQLLRGSVHKPLRMSSKKTPRLRFTMISPYCCFLTKALQVDTEASLGGHRASPFPVCLSRERLRWRLLCGLAHPIKWQRALAIWPSRWPRVSRPFDANLKINWFGIMLFSRLSVCYQCITSMDSLEFLRSTNGENNISILRNQVVRVREFAIVFPSTLPYPGRAVDGEFPQPFFPCLFFCETQPAHEISVTLAR